MILSNECNVDFRQWLSDNVGDLFLLLVTYKKKKKERVTFVSTCIEKNDGRNLVLRTSLFTKVILSSVKDNSLLTLAASKETAIARKLTNVDDWRFVKGERTFKHAASDCTFLTLMSQLHPAEGVRAHDIARGRATLDAVSYIQCREPGGLESRRSAGAAAMQAGRVYRRAVAHAINVQTASMVIPFPYGKRQCSLLVGPCTISRNTGRSRPPSIMQPAVAIVY